MWVREQGSLGVGYPAQETDPQPSQLGEGTSVTGLSSWENRSDQHVLEVPPWKPSAEDMCYSACVLSLQRGGDNWARLSPSPCKMAVRAGSHRILEPWYPARAKGTPVSAGKIPALS